MRKLTSITRERIRGRAIMENYPRRPDITTSAVIGIEDVWVSAAVGTVLKIMGTGDVYTTLSKFVYPGDPRPWHVVSVIELRDGKVTNATIFGAAFDAPEWRARWVERT